MQLNSLFVGIGCMFGISGLVNAHMSALVELGRRMERVRRPAATAEVVPITRAVRERRTSMPPPRTAPNTAPARPLPRPKPQPQPRHLAGERVR